MSKEGLQNADGSYNTYNVWNTTKGAMHLNCPANSLSAEVFIAGESAVPWGCCSKNREDCEQESCKANTNGADLIQCGGYGLPTRASDTTIGSNVNNLIQQGLVVSIANPVGLYLEDLNTTGWQAPDGKAFDSEVLKNTVRYVRGSPGQNLRIIVEIPQTEEYVLIAGEPIDWAGQVIDASVTVFLTGIAISGAKVLSEDVATKAVVPCKSQWKYTADTLIGPLPRSNALYPEPEHPVEGVSDEKRKEDLGYN